MGLIERIELKEINDNGNEVELMFNAYIGSNIPTKTSVIVTKEQLKTLKELVD